MKITSCVSISTFHAEDTGDPTADCSSMNRPMLVMTEELLPPRTRTGEPRIRPLLLRNLTARRSAWLLQSPVSLSLDSHNFSYAWFNC